MRNLYDIQSVLYVVLYFLLITWQWINGFSWSLYGLLLFITVGVQIIHHNHVHLGIWNSKLLNHGTSLTISLFTAVPSAMMYGGHIKNHHRHQHGPEDITRTYRFGGDHNHAWGYLLHPFQAFSVLIPKFWQDFVEGWPKGTRFSKELFLQCCLIGLVWVILALIDWRNFLLLVLAPQAFGLHWLLGANYFQHAHCDDQSKSNYARNFTGIINYFWFNIGFHTAHHDHPKAHWSTLRTLHDREYQHVDPRLRHRSFFLYAVRTLLIGSVVPAYASQTLKEPLPTQYESNL